MSELTREEQARVEALRRQQEETERRRQIEAQIKIWEEERDLCNELVAKFATLQNMIANDADYLQLPYKMEMTFSPTFFSGNTAFSANVGLDSIKEDIGKKIPEIRNVEGAIMVQIGSLNSYIDIIENNIATLRSSM